MSITTASLSSIQDSIQDSIPADRREDNVALACSEKNSALQSNPTASQSNASQSNDSTLQSNATMSKYAAKQAAKLAKQKQKAVALPQNRPEARISRKLTISKSHRELLLTCAKTGIVATLSVPTVPGKTLIYSSPFTSIANVRGIIQEGEKYLSSLETQILAGLLITILEHYELLSEHDIIHSSGATKNAILRNAGIEALTRCLLTVETLINSVNHIYVPRLSLALEEVTKQHDIQARLSNWTSILIDSLKVPDTSLYDENVKPEKIIFSSMKRVKGANNPEAAKNLARKNFFHDKKKAKAIIQAMRCSSKMRDFLTNLFTADNLLNADPMMIGLLIGKLEGAEDSANALKIISLLKADRKILIDDQVDDGLDDLADGPFPSPASQVSESKSSERSEDNSPTNSSNSHYNSEDRVVTFVSQQKSEDGLRSVQSDSSTESKQQKSEDKEIIVSSEVDSSSFSSILSAQKAQTGEPDFSSMSFVEKIKAKREWMKQQGILKAQQNPNDGFSPASQLIIPPVYKPSPEKIKLAGPEEEEENKKLGDAPSKEAKEE